MKPTLRRIGDGLPFSAIGLLQGCFDLRFDRFWCEELDCEFRIVLFKDGTLKARKV
jgi:hypothetical protein